MPDEECPLCEDQFGGQMALISQVVEWVELKNDIFIISVIGSDKSPPFSYTVGMERNFSHPEILIFGLDADISKRILNGIKDLVKEGLKIEEDQRTKGVFPEFDAIFKSLSKPEIDNLLKVAIWYYRSSTFRAMQCVWPDDKNIFPWEEGYNERFREMQL